MDEMLKAEIKDIYGRIADLERQKKFPEVKELLRQLLAMELTPMLRAMALNNLSLIEEQMGNIPAALEAIEEARRIAPEGMQIYLWIEQVNLLDCHGRWTESLELCCRIANYSLAPESIRKTYQKKIDEITKFQKTGKKPGGFLGGFLKNSIRLRQNVSIDEKGNVTWL